MSLQVWLPLNGDIKNYGLSNISTSLLSGTSYTNNGKIGKALFNSGDGQGVNLPSAMTTLSGYSNYSMCAWVYMTSTATNHSSTILSSGNWNTSASQCCFGFYNYNNGYGTLLCPNKSGWSGGISLSSRIQLVTWYHVCITYDGTTTKGYINGEYVGSYSGGGITSTSETNNAYVGSATYYTGFTLKGYINDFRIYDNALSVEEIKEISQALVLHYPLRDTGIEPTTNIYSGWSGTCYNGVNGKYGYGSETDIYYTSLPDDVKRVYTGTNFATNWPFVYFGNLTPSVGNYKTISFDYYPSALTGINFYSYNTSGSISWILNGQAGTGGNITGIVLDKWNHIEVTIKNTGSTTDGFGYMRIGTSSHTTNVSNFWMFKNVQIEEKDHATAYTTGTRTIGTIADCSGYNRNGTVTSSTCPIVVNGGGRNSICYQFDGTDDLIVASVKQGDILSDKKFTISAWVYLTEWTNYRGVFGPHDTGGAVQGIFFCQSDEQQVHCGFGNGSSWLRVRDSGFPLNTWVHYVMTYDGSKEVVYRNGTKVGEVSGSIVFDPENITIGRAHTNSSSINRYWKGKISDFRIYATALSADDVARLYKTSASIDKKKTLHCYELIEE